VNELIRPLTMHELLQDPVYKKYLLKAPRLPKGCRPPNPWRVWGLRTDDKWAGKLFPDYVSAFGLVKDMLKNPRYVDVVITCRPVEFAPPAHFQIPPLMEWCGYCRRPTVYRRLTARHHVIKKWPVFSNDGSRRCIYCANREPQHRWYAQ
jgi:hypothetical protein